MSATGEFGVPVGGGYFPPLLLVESMAQLAGIAAGQHPGEGGVLAALGRVELPATVLAGVRYTVHSKVVKTFGRLVMVEGEVRESERVIASAMLTLGIGAG